MAPATPRTKHALSFSPDELVVATSHVELVVQGLGTSVRVKDTSEELGLTLLTLDDVGETAARLGSAHGDPAHRGDGDLDAVLTNLRKRFAAAWDGWVPTFGKNRDVLGGETPYLKPLTDPAAPKPVDSEDAPYSGAAARDRGEGGKGVHIGILDTPVSGTTAALPWVTAGPADVLDHRLDPVPYRLGHATFLAGLAHQYAPDATITSRAVLSGHDATGTAWDVALGLVDLVKPRPGSGRPAADVVIMALGCFTVDRRPPLVLQTAVNLLRDDAVLLAAAGNYADMSAGDMRAAGVTRTTPMWPAALDGVTAVGSTSREGAFSTFSPTVPWVDVAAHGELLSSTYLDGKVLFGTPSKGNDRVESYHGFARWSGTSLSVSVAAGRLAAMREDGEPLPRTLRRMVDGDDAPWVVRAQR